MPHEEPASSLRSDCRDSISELYTDGSTRVTFRQWFRDLASASYEELSQWTERSVFQGDDPSCVGISAQFNWQ